MHPATVLATLLAGATLMSAVLIGTAAPGERPASREGRGMYVALADTDSTAVPANKLRNQDSIAVPAAGLVNDETVVADSTLADSTASGPALPDSMVLGPADSIVTDSTVLNSGVVDSTVADSTLADSAGARRDTSLVDRYLHPFERDRRTASLFQRRTSPLSTGLGNYWKHQITLDSTSNTYVAREMVGGADVRYPLELDADQYRQARLEEDITDNWSQILTQREQQRNAQKRGGLGFDIVIPGGRQSAFATIFGAPKVDLRVTGQANILAGFDQRTSKQMAVVGGKTSRLDPTFKQDLSLGIVGTIGDKLSVDVSWDTKNQFDYQNQLKLRYKGHEDEIVQSVEAGNVILNTPSTLIRGGQSLFGLKSEFQLGGLHLTTVASQQEGEANSLAINGGAQSRSFEISPIDYDDNKHFFLGYYFRNRWEEALSTPPNILLADGFEQIEDIEVWKLDPQARNSQTQGVRTAVAMVDLAEPWELLTEADSFKTPILPGPNQDQYDEQFLQNQIRDGSAKPSSNLGQAPHPLQSFDYQVGKFRLLEEGSDYDLDPTLGYISLRSGLAENEALAVSYRMRTINGTVQIGDFSTQSGGTTNSALDDKLVLKLLRPTQLQAPALNSDQSGFNPAAWYLEMRNIYDLQSRGINANDFQLDIYYVAPGRTASKTLPGSNDELLSLLGLDRLGIGNSSGRDFQFDYLPDFTIDPDRGLLIFPYLQPFGSRIDEVLRAREGSDYQQDSTKFEFTDLYIQKKENARKLTLHDVYRIRGSFKGAVQSYYNLNAFAGLVPGSVHVTSGGTPLQEGSDYTVDYQGATVNIINPAYLTAGRGINITYEQNQFLNIQKKTLLGARADYTVSDNLTLGATVMRLNQKSPVDKFRLGDEPVSNMIWGVDGNWNLEPRWLTRAVDALPLIQTKAPSAIHLTGEFAQLRPGNAQTLAFQRTRKELLRNNRDFSSDELHGVSYLDDFEGFESNFSLRQAGGWSISAAPDSITAVDGVGRVFGALGDSLRTNWRGLFGWYTLFQGACNEIREECAQNPLVARQIRIQDVYPNRQTQPGTNDLLTTLDLYYDPHERGPYNYTRDLKGFIDNPQLTWGGITQHLPEGYNDFTLKNIEFIDLIVSPIAENQANDAGPNAKLLLDLGSISEDVLPDEQPNMEDGLSSDLSQPPDVDAWGRLPTGTQDLIVTVDQEKRRTDDLGLDGLASYDPDHYIEETVDVTEQSFFGDFLQAAHQALDAASPADPNYKYLQAEVAKADHDPSGDDYYFYGDDDYYGNPDFFPADAYPNGATLQQRYSRYYAGVELNSFQGQQELGTSSSRRGISRVPDTEDINANSTSDTDDNYFEYEIPLSLAKLNEFADNDRDDGVDGDYVVTRISGDGTPQNPGWFLVRVPLQRPTRRIGNIQDFTLIESIRLWTTGHTDPFTLRIAGFDLVGSQWQKATEVIHDPDYLVVGQDDSKLGISSVNTEENRNTYASPPGTVVNQIRSTLGTGTVPAREQSMALTVQNLMPGHQQAIYKTYQEENLLKYSNMRMFVHMHGTLGSGENLGQMAMTDLERARSKAKLFIRIGSNQTTDYYEYEQPLTPSLDPSSTQSQNADALWRTRENYNGEIVDLNSVNIELAALNALKVLRDRMLSEGVTTQDSIFWSSDVNGVHQEGAPDVSEFAPPGARIGIKGNPTLAKVNTLVIGIRNPGDPVTYTPEDVLQQVTVWVNELRTSGYDEKVGSAGLFNADIQLADVGRIKANLNMQTDGFGGLNSTLGDRDQTAINNWGILTSLNLDKFIPERFGWTLPVTFQIQSNTSTPRFSPQRGDVRLAEIYGLTTDLTPAQRDSLKRATLDEAQTYSLNRSFTASLQKSGSKSQLLQHTLDGLALNYSYSDAAAHNPTQRQNDQWRWAGSVSYRLGFRKPHTVRPLWFLEDVPILGAFGGIRLNYLPQSVTAAGSVRRFFASQQQRPPNVNSFDALRYPTRQQHSLEGQRTFGMDYNPFTFLNLSYDVSTDQNLSAVGVDTLTSMVMPDGSVNDHPTRAEMLAHPDSLLYTLVPTPTGQIVSRLFSGRSPRTEQYDQRFSATFQPKFAKAKAFDWITFQPVTYSATFGWNNGPVGQIVGATVNSRVDIKGGISLRPQDLWRKFGFYRHIEDAQKRADQEKKQEREQREKERRERREQEKAARAAEKEAGQAAADST
ncbi:MAG TPA: cell surface protein SprA, partial [Rhodothermales bacterium]|nr:cell surface protein SprA [Rhodothermales bacterium]